MLNSWNTHDRSSIQPVETRGVEQIEIEDALGERLMNVRDITNWAAVQKWRRVPVKSLSEIGAGSVQATLSERGKTHGDFTEQGGLSQNLKAMVRMDATKWSKLSPAMRESIEMVLHKVSRIVNGNPSEPDHWRDIAGYATLVENILTTGKSHT